jgi:hypothetical protein
VKRMIGSNGTSVNGEFSKATGTGHWTAGGAWQTVAFLSLVLALATAGCGIFLWQWKHGPVAPPCTPSLVVECPIPWLPDVIPIASFGGSLLGAAVCFFREQKFGRWLFASLAMLTVPILTSLMERWIAGGH